MQHWRVLHDFIAEEAVELSVAKNELVRAATDAVRANGWIRVEVAASPERSGFVPLSYLRPATPEGTSGTGAGATSSGSPAAVVQTETSLHWHHSEGVAEASHTPQRITPAPQAVGGARASPPSPSLAPHPVPPASQERQPSPQGAVGEASARPTPPAASLQAAFLAAGAGVDGAAAVEAFMKREVYFRQLMRQRAEAVTGMREGLDAVRADVVACKERNATLSARLRELDGVIERERRRWSERVETERGLVARALAGDTPPSAELVAAERTSSVS